MYQGGNDKLAAVPLTATIRDAAGKSVFSKADTIAADQYSTDRAADYQLRLPVAKLAVGDYLLTFEATSGKVAARRDVRFQVR